MADNTDVIEATANEYPTWTGPDGAVYKLSTRRMSALEIAMTIRLEKSTDILDQYELILRSIERLIDKEDQERFLKWAQTLDDGEMNKVMNEITMLLLGRPTSPSVGSTDGSSTTGPVSVPDSSETVSN